MKQFFSSKFSKKYLAIALLAFLALAVFAMSSGVALAAATSTSANAPVTPPSAWSCNPVTGNLATCSVNFITYIISQFAGWLIAVAAWIIQVALQLGGNIYNSPFIQNGFGICLSIANLGFVLAIIVIALATIFRSETYGYKKTLWRLIIMAILVNFGLVITAPLVSFANGMTTYFMNSISGSTQGVPAFVNQLAQATNPAAADQAPVTNPTGCAAAVTLQQNNHLPGLSPQPLPQGVLIRICQDYPDNPSVAANFSQAVLALFFAIIFKAVIALAFFSIGALLFVRYIWLGILLTLLPLAWLTWIFPKFGHEFGAWWSNFIKWTFFAPAAMFFIWLALLIQKSAYFSQVFNTTNPSTPATTVALATGSINTLNPFMNNVIVLSIMIGGLMAAASMTGKAGSFVVAQAKGVSGAVTGYVGRRTKQTAKRVATAPFRGEGMRNLSSRLQQRSDNAVLRGTGLNWLGRKFGQGAESIAIAGGSKNVDAQEERFKKMTPDQRRNRLSGVEWENAPAQRMKLLKMVMDDKNLKKLSSDEMERYFGKSQEATFKRFGQEKLYKDLREKSGLGLRDLDKEVEDLRAEIQTKGIDKEVEALKQQPQPLTKVDTEKLDAGTEKLDKLTEKEAERIKMAAVYAKENTEEVADSFTDPAKLKEKREKSMKAVGYVPAALDEDSLNSIQRNITEGIAKGFSPEIVNMLIKEVSKKNNLDPFGTALKKHSDKNPQIKLDFAANERMLSWNDKQFSRGALDVNLRDFYGLPRSTPVPPPPTPTP